MSVSEDLSWLEEEGLTDMDPRKLALIRDLVAESRGKSMQQALPILVKATKRLKKENMAFTPKETTMLLALLTKDMSPEEKKRYDAMKNAAKTGK